MTEQPIKSSMIATAEGGKGARGILAQISAKECVFTVIENGNCHSCTLPTDLATWPEIAKAKPETLMDMLLGAGRGIDHQEVIIQAARMVIAKRRAKETTKDRAALLYREGIPIAAEAQTADDYPDALMECAFGIEWRTCLPRRAVSASEQLKAAIAAIQTMAGA